MSEPVRSPQSDNGRFVLKTDHNRAADMALTTIDDLTDKLVKRIQEESQRLNRKIRQKDKRIASLKQGLLDAKASATTYVLGNSELDQMQFVSKDEYDRACGLAMTTIRQLEFEFQTQLEVMGVKHEAHMADTRDLVRSSANQIANQLHLLRFEQGENKRLKDRLRRYEPLLDTHSTFNSSYDDKPTSTRLLAFRNIHNSPEDTVVVTSRSSTLSFIDRTVLVKQGLKHCLRLRNADEVEIVFDHYTSLAPLPRVVGVIDQLALNINCRRYTQKFYVVDSGLDLPHLWLGSFVLAKTGGKITSLEIKSAGKSSTLIKHGCNFTGCNHKYATAQDLQDHEKWHGIASRGEHRQTNVTSTKTEALREEITGLETIDTQSPFGSTRVNTPGSNANMFHQHQLKTEQVQQPFPAELLPPQSDHNYRSTIRVSQRRTTPMASSIFESVDLSSIPNIIYPEPAQNTQTTSRDSMKTEASGGYSSPSEIHDLPDATSVLQDSGTVSKGSIPVTAGTPTGSDTPRDSASNGSRMEAADNQNFRTDDDDHEACEPDEAVDLCEEEDEDHSSSI